jgi:hypothetical protein
VQQDLPLHSLSLAVAVHKQKDLQGGSAAESAR